MMGSSWLLLLLLLSLSQTCSITDNVMPPSGSCEGPTERAVAKLTNAEPFNGGCPNNQVQYYKDGGTESKCGDCVPGTSGIEDPERLCGINEFCNDNATCQLSKTSPLYLEPCPYEQGITSSTKQRQG